jgi:hypothetical protein
VDDTCGICGEDVLPCGDSTNCKFHMRRQRREAVNSPALSDLVEHYERLAPSGYRPEHIDHEN